MRWWFVALAACSTNAPGKPLGTVTVTVYSNATHSTDFVTQGKPLPGASVFEDAGQVVMTDGNGEATLEVTHDPATIHVASMVGPGAVTTVAGIPVGGHAWIGNRPYFMSIGIAGVTLQDIGATSYDVAAPSCMIHGGVNGNRVGFTINMSCGNQQVRVVGVAIASSGTKVVEQDIAVSGATLGPFSDATVYAPMPTNLPDLPSPPTVKIGLVGPQGFAVTLPTLAGPADANRVVLKSGDTTAGSTLAVDGPIGATVDASHMLPVPDVGTVDEHGASWSIPASAAQPNLIEIDVAYGMTSWTVYAPPSMISVAFPKLPADLASLAPTQAPTSGTLHVYELPRAALTFDELAGSFDGLTAPVRADHQPIAASQRSF